MGGSLDAQRNSLPTVSLFFDEAHGTFTSVFLRFLLVNTPHFLHSFCAQNRAAATEPRFILGKGGRQSKVYILVDRRRGKRAEAVRNQLCALRFLERLFMSLNGNASNDGFIPLCPFDISISTMIHEISF